MECARASAALRHGESGTAFRTPRRFALLARGREAALECARASAAFSIRQRRLGPLRMAAGCGANGPLISDKSPPYASGKGSLDCNHSHYFSIVR